MSEGGAQDSNPGHIVDKPVRGSELDLNKFKSF